MKKARGNGKYFIGNGRKSGGKNGGKRVCLILYLHYHHRVAKAIKRDYRLPCGLPQPIANIISGYAAKHRSRSGDKSEPEPFLWFRNHHGNHEHVRRNKKNRTLDKRDKKQHPRGARMRDPFESPMI